MSEQYYYITEEKHNIKIDKQKMILPDIIEIQSKKNEIKKIYLNAPLNYFLNLNKKNTVEIYRYFWLEKLEVFFAKQEICNLNVDINGRKGIKLIENRIGEGRKVKMIDYFIENKKSWNLVTEIFERSDGILRLNKSHNNGFPKVLEINKPYKSKGRIFKLIGSTSLIIGSSKYDCIKIIMEKEPCSGNKGFLQFFLNKNCELIYKANYHPKSEYPTVSFKNSIKIRNETFGILHCSILASILKRS